MNAIRTLLTNLRHVLACAGEMFRYALMFLWAIFCPKMVLAARLLAAENQFAVCRHGIASKKQPIESLDTTRIGQHAKCFVTLAFTPPSG